MPYRPILATFYTVDIEIQFHYIIYSILWQYAIFTYNDNQYIKVQRNVP